MLTAVDHIVVGVGDVPRAVDTYRSLGFSVSEPHVMEDGATAAHVFFGDFYLELSNTGQQTDFPRLVFRTDHLDAEVARLTSDGLPVTWSGRRAQFDSVIPIALVEDGPNGPEPDATPHRNTATELERTYIAVESIDRELKVFERLLGMPGPEPEMGTVIMSLMSVFYVGGIGIAVAEPRGPGPTADALAAKGPGMFQVLFRAEHLDQAEATMVANGLPQPERGTRLSGESALLVRPENACNLYVAFAGKP